MTSCSAAGRWVSSVLPTPGVVDVVPAVLGQAVVRRVVQAAKAQRRPVLVALGGVVVDDVEQDLEARGMERADHLLELGDGVARGRVLVVRGKVADRLVAPVVA